MEATQLFRPEVLGDYSIHGLTKVLYDIVIVRVTNVARRGLGMPPCPSLTSQARYTGLRWALCRPLNQGAFLSALINETGSCVGSNFAVSLFSVLCLVKGGLWASLANSS
jgi:hypothetical protein